MSVIAWAIVGAVTADSAQITAQVDVSDSDDGEPELLIGEDADLVGTVTPLSPSETRDRDDDRGEHDDTDGNARNYLWNVAGLSSDTKYYFQLQLDDHNVDNTIGEFRTHAEIGKPVNFSFAAASCAGTGPETEGVGDVVAPTRVSNSSVFTSIREQEPLFFVHMGDMAYYDIGNNKSHGVEGYNKGTYRRQWDDVMRQPRQNRLYRNVPLVYCWDDHDFGPNDSHKGSPGLDNANTVYRERFPHYPLQGGNRDDDVGIGQSWMVGRVQFVMPDLRTFRDPNPAPESPGKTAMGDEQRDWFEGVLRESWAKMLVFISTQEWRPSGRGDAWPSYPDEQEWLLDKFRKYGWLDRMVIVAGDSHFMGFASGAHTKGGMPYYLCSPLNSRYLSQSDLSTFDVGVTTDEQNHYGLFTITDDGSRIRFKAEAHHHDDVQYSHDFEIVTEGQEPDPGEEPGEPDEPADPPPSRQQKKSDYRGPLKYTLVVADLVTDRDIGRLEPTDLNFSKKISDSGDMSATVPITGRVQMDTVRAMNVRPCAVYVERQTTGYAPELWWGGIGWKCEVKKDTRELLTASIQADTFDSITKYRYPWETVTFEDDDAADVFRKLWERMQKGKNADLHVEVPHSQKAGQTIDKKVHSYEDDNFEDILKDLSDGVFEWTIDVYYTPRSLKRHRILRTGAPLLGQSGTPHLLTQPGNVLSWEWPGDMTRYKTHFRVTGSDTTAESDGGGNVGSDHKPIVSTVAEADDWVDSGYPRVDDADNVDTNSKSKVDREAKRMRDNAVDDARVPKITSILPDTIEPNRIGDTVRFMSAEDSWFGQDTRKWRIASMKVTAATRDSPDEVEFELLNQGELATDEDEDDE